MDLGITTYTFLILNCLLLILGFVRILVSICLAVISTVVFANNKEISYSPLIGDAVFLGANEEAMFLLGILAGFKNNVRLLYAYQLFIGILAFSKMLTLHQTEVIATVIHDDITLSTQDIMREHEGSNLNKNRLDDIQKHCCGLDGPEYWLRVLKSNYSLQNLPRSCCQNETVRCIIEDAWLDGCLKKINSKFPELLLRIHKFTLYPVFEVILFFVGVLLIIFIKNTASNTLA